MITVDEILESLNSAVNEPKHIAWHSFLSLPKAHRFASWFIASEDFSGSDERAEIKESVVKVNFFFKDYVNDDDMEMVREFTENVRSAGAFSSASGLDDANGVFYTSFTFNVSEEL